MKNVRKSDVTENKRFLKILKMTKLKDILAKRQTKTT